MKEFMPHDLVGWLTALTSISGAVWVIIKFTFVKSFDQLNDTIKELKNTIGSVDQRLDDLDKRTLHLEDWREYHSRKDDKYSLPVLDMYAESGIAAFNDTQASQYLMDGLHPNQAGEYRVAKRVVDFVRSHL